MSRMDASPIPDGSPPIVRPRTVAFMNQKGGVGKTTTTVNLGAAFAMRGRKCLLVDLDPQAHCTLHFGIEPGNDAATAYDLLLDPDCSVYEVLHRGRNDLDIIPAETSLAAAEVELTTQPGREMILREKLEPILPQYDYVFFDCPPSLGLLTLNALVASREVVIPMQAHFLPLQGVGKLLETIALVRQRLNRELTVTGIVLCSHDGQTTLAREIVADLRAFFESGGASSPWQECAIFEPPIRRNIKLAEAPSFGQTVFEYASWCHGAQDYAALAEHLLQFWEGPTAAVDIVHEATAELDDVEDDAPEMTDETATESPDQDAAVEQRAEPPLIDVDRTAPSSLAHTASPTSAPPREHARADLAETPKPIIEPKMEHAPVDRPPTRPLFRASGPGPSATTL